MMFELGDGIAIAGVAIPAAAVWITAIKTRKTNGNGYVKQGEFKECVKRLEEHMTSIDGDIGDINNNIREILKLHLKSV